MKFIGQQKLIDKLNNLTLQSLPKSILLLGESGCGKHTFAKMIAQKFNLAIEEISEKITASQILEIHSSPVETLYIIDLMNFTDKQQNQFLKLIEEPGYYNYIVLLAESENGILPTIINRCNKFQFEDYKKEDLKTILDIQNELVYKVCRTPGQLVDINVNHIDELFNLCQSITKAISGNTYVNTLTIAAKINYKEEFNKYDFNLFLNMLRYVSFTDFLETNNPASFKIFTIVNNYNSMKVNKSIVKENFILNLITNIWEALN